MTWCVIFELAFWMFCVHMQRSCRFFVCGTDLLEIKAGNQAKCLFCLKTTGGWHASCNTVKSLKINLFCNCLPLLTPPVWVSWAFCNKLSQPVGLFFLNWSIADLQCCANFCCTTKWFSYTYVYILFHILFHYCLSQDIEYSLLCSTVRPCCVSILYIIVCIC